MGWFSDHWKSLVTVAVSTTVFVGVTALTGGLGAPVVASLLIAGAASGASGSITSRLLDGRAPTVGGTLRAAAIGAAVSLATAGVGKAFSPLLDRVAAPVVGAAEDALPGELSGAVRATVDAVPDPVRDAIGGAASGGALGAGQQAGDNLIHGRPVTDNIFTASFEGSLGNAVGHPALEAVKAAQSPPSHGVVGALEGDEKASGPAPAAEPKAAQPPAPAPAPAAAPETAPAGDGLPPPAHRAR
jgi:hypothetical protein